MIEFLEGSLVEKHPTRVVINCSGVGYEIFIPLTTHAAIPSVGDRVRLLTVLHVRDDARLLYGFADPQDRAMFRLFIGVAGVGPKIALAALSRLSASELAAALSRGDVAACRSIPGVGAKLANRIMTELRDAVLSGQNTAIAGVAGVDEPDIIRDAELALAALGYKPDDARRAVSDAVRRNPALRSQIELLIRAAIDGA